MWDLDIFLATRNTNGAPETVFIATPLLGTLVNSFLLMLPDLRMGCTPVSY
jgi:hypothetical protein